MKLAEALHERADLNRRVEQLRFRLENSALVQEGECPAEAPEALLEELERCTARLEELMVRINLTNSRATVDGLTLTELIAKKDCLSLKISVYLDLLQQAGQTTRRAPRSEIKILSTVDVARLQKETDQMSQQLRLLDNRLQQTNWSVDL